jgi:hypothetical protein
MDTFNIKGAADRDKHGYRGSGPPPNFRLPPFARRPKLFCCAVAESNPAHLPRSFVNPGRHLMNSQLQSFLECADDENYTLAKCEVSHLVEVTTRALENQVINPAAGRQREEQWNRSGHRPPVQGNDRRTPPGEGGKDFNMLLDEDETSYQGVPYSTYRSTATRSFVTQNSTQAWQNPPHSRSYRDPHPDPSSQGNKAGVEQYMEIPPFKTMPYTSDSHAGGSGGGGGVGARQWIPSCSVLMWCVSHSNFYEVHVFS